MPPMQPGDKKKKKIAPQLLGPVGSAAPSGAFAAGAGGTKAGGAGAAPAGGSGSAGAAAEKGSSSGYLRLKRAAEDGSASVKQLRAATKAHNERYCIKMGGTKAELRGRISRVAKRFDAISGGGKAKKPKPGGGGSGGGGGTAGQKKTAAALKKMNKVLAKNKTGEDAFPELAF
jgi:hypothetical protein